MTSVGHLSSRCLHAVAIASYLTRSHLEGHLRKVIHSCFLRDSVQLLDLSVTKFDLYEILLVSTGGSAASLV